MRVDSATSQSSLAYYLYASSINVWYDTSMKKKLLLSAFVVVSFVAYSLHERQEAGHAAAVNPSRSKSTTTTPTTTTPSTSTTVFKDGNYTGSVADAFYGNIQVKAVIQGGKLTDVQFLQYPNDQPNSVQVSMASMPVLKQEAIQAQSARVDTVTGATDTSQAFVQSLGAALASAKS